MANNQCLFITEGAYLTRPPSFIGEDYPYWKEKIEMYIKSTSIESCSSLPIGIFPLPDLKLNGQMTICPLWSSTQKPNIL